MAGRRLNSTRTWMPRTGSSIYLSPRFLLPRPPPFSQPRERKNIPLSFLISLPLPVSVCVCLCVSVRLPAHRPKGTPYLPVHGRHKPTSTPPAGGSASRARMERAKRTNEDKTAHTDARYVQQYYGTMRNPPSGGGPSFHQSLFSPGVSLSRFFERKKKSSPSSPSSPPPCPPVRPPKVCVCLCVCVPNP